MNNDSVFRYSYSAKQNEEVQAIRSKYLPQPENKLDELKRLDQLVNNAGILNSTGIELKKSREKNMLGNPKKERPVL